MCKYKMKMKRYFSHALCLVALTLLASSCSKKVTDAMSSQTGVSAPLVEVVQKVNDKRADLAQVSGHVSLDLSMGSQSVKVSGELKMKRNSIIQLTLQALGGLITVGRLEFTPSDMLVMDNMNKRYVKLPYSEIPFLQENGIDFYAFQALLWNELFLPGTKDNAPRAQSFECEQQGSDWLLKHQTAQLQLSFLTGSSSGKLQQTSIKGKAQAQRGMTCDYQGWGSIKNEAFPNKMSVGVALGAQSVNAKLDITKLRTDDSWKGVATSIDTKKFQQLTLQQVWAAVMSLAN